jgi:choline dehydrogenase-like flavoprotein
MLPVQASKDITRAAFRPQENAILQPHGTAGRVHNPLYPHAEGCTFCGFCFQGCIEPRQSPRNLRAKRSTDNSYMPMALTADLWRRGGKAVKLLTDAYVTQIHTTTKGSQTIAGGVTWRDNVTGDMHSESAKVVVMAGGCVETPRLWLNSRLPNPNGWVGKGFTDHYFDWIIGVMPHDIGSSRGAGSNARCDFPGYGGLEQVGLPPALQAFSATFSNAGMAGYYDNGASASGVSKQGAQSLGRLVGKDLLNLVEQVDRMLNVLVLTDDDVQPQNQVSLSTSLPPDEHGPVPRVSFPRGIRTARTLRNREYLAAKAVELVKHAGATRVYRLDWPDLILHVQSTMRMGSDPSTSVVDASSEARFVKRLFIADNSALANCLGGPNPTLTSQALATRAAQTIFTRYFGGHPWVGHEAPVSSIDDRVTQAVFARGIADAPASSRKPSRPSTHRKSVPRPTFTG